LKKKEKKRNIIKKEIPSDFGNTVKEMVISYFFESRSFFLIFLAGLISHIRVRAMICSDHNTTYPEIQ
jgi:hypothetical protein